MRSIMLTVLGLALLTPDFADAQIFGRGRGYGGSGWGVGVGNGGISYQQYDGYGRGYGYGDGWGSGGYGRGYGYGDGWGSGGYGRGYGYGGNPYYGGSGVAFGNGYYGNTYGGSYPNYGGGYSSYPSYGNGMVYSNPSYMSGGYSSGGYMSGGYMSNDMSGGNMYQAGYSSGMNMGNVVRLDIIVPDENTELTIQGQRVSGTGRHRSFVSPQLESGKEYTYTVSIRGSQTRDGEDTRKIDVRAGSQYTIDFTRPQGERLPAPGSGFETDRPRNDTNRDRDNRDNRDRDLNRDRDNNRPGSGIPGTNPGGNTNPPR